MSSRVSKKRVKHYSIFGMTQHKAHFADYTIYVQVSETGYQGGYSIRADKQLPQEIKDAIVLWITNGQYAQMELKDYLNKIFDRLEYI